MITPRGKLRQRVPPEALARALACLLPVLTAGCDYDFPGKPQPADRPVPDNQVLDFAWLYRRNCAGCHGADGRLGPAPPLNDALFLAIVPDAELLRVISDGRHGTPMPGFAPSSGGPLTAAQVSALADGIKSRWKPAAESAETIPAYLWAKSAAAIPAADDHARGAAVFARAWRNATGRSPRPASGRTPASVRSTSPIFWR